MACSNTISCPCINEECKNRGVCCQCVYRHKNLNNLPFCLVGVDTSSCQEILEDEKKLKEYVKNAQE